MSLTKQQLMGLIGALLLFIGVFMPVASLPIMGPVTMLVGGNIDGYLILGLSIVSIIVIFMHQFRALLLTGGISLAILLFKLYQFISKFRDAKKEVVSSLEGNPFASMAGTLIDSVQIQFGWAVLVVASVILIFSVFYRDSEGEEYLPLAAEPKSNMDQQSLPSHSILNQQPQLNSHVVTRDAFSYYADSSSLNNENDIEYKSCPHCAENIKITAIKCKHCGGMIDE
ncbi:MULTISPECIES: zinc ribbon domain-containing protein [unclassified Acinetobacter]|uniref:zinc ribbon domain-containing protein n=1 Tax=unclassified Acinetobacter TaxID=196816 RepID=UPI00244D68E0|nr:MULTISPECIES: zinc ribbon domain-containing protein [unclassified Acinetobacter]MDH0032005.1 zinc ribbon domain-containing protein [Acinetobacter sp. GD04021]MDH0887661.1 zinc ribbon domain-containing protein [Acinetobacter sp. GD03873]MDH1084009.1 zinc ribbon domain-containing protein [Acinetobacter sp. GD03983]MDH2191064.1 zinc ribbon domain-containing protein [Acinetobacter sp. GD03645]MDH2204521.1 zinc ribbon domain-containing protein [Acinetobacter sp. GD03647]